MTLFSDFVSYFERWSIDWIIRKRYTFNHLQNASNVIGACSSHRICYETDVCLIFSQRVVFLYALSIFTRNNMMVFSLQHVLQSTILDRRIVTRTTIVRKQTHFKDTVSPLTYQRFRHPTLQVYICVVITRPFIVQNSEIFECFWFRLSNHIRLPSGRYWSISNIGRPDDRQHHIPLAREITWRRPG